MHATRIARVQEQIFVVTDTANDCECDDKGQRAVSTPNNSVSERTSGEQEHEKVELCALKHGTFSLCLDFFKREAQKCSLHTVSCSPGDQGTQLQLKVQTYSEQCITRRSVGVHSSVPRSHAKEKNALLTNPEFTNRSFTSAGETRSPLSREAFTPQF